MTRRAFFAWLPVALVAGPSEEHLLDGGRVWERRWGWLGRRRVRIEAAGGGPALTSDEIAHAREMARRMAR